MQFSQDQHNVMQTEDYNSITQCHSAGSARQQFKFKCNKCKTVYHEVFKFNHVVWYSCSSTLAYNAFAFQSGCSCNV